MIGSELREHGRWEGALEVFRKVGSIFDAYVRDSVMVADDGSSTDTIAGSVDVSERVAHERTMLASHEHLQTVTDSMGEEIVTIDVDGYATSINGAAEELLGWSAQDLADRGMHQTTHSRRPDGSPLHIDDCPIQRARRERKVTQVDEDIFMGRDWRQIPVAYTASPIETADGVRGCVVVFEDITERKAREEALRRDADGPA